MSDDDAASRAWIAAGEDLGIEVIAPAVVTVGALTVRAQALLPQFGAPSGMLVFDLSSLRDRSPGTETTLVQHGYSYSYSRWEPYRRDNFVDVLEDWGWVSSEPAPSWYTDRGT